MVMMRFLVIAAILSCTLAATPFTHSWDTVRNVMGMHGKYKTTPPQEDIEFIAKTYPYVTTGTGCDPSVNSTIEDSVLSVARRIKALNSSVEIGMYWRSEFVLEIAECSAFASEWKNHPEWYLKDDQGTVIRKGSDYYIDYANKDAAAFFAQVLLNVTSWKLPSGDPVLDYVYIDGVPGNSSSIEYQKGIGPVRSEVLYNSIYATYADIQQQMDIRGNNQRVILNGLDTDIDADKHWSSGTAGSMFDHWSILQFLNRTNGDFNASMMDEAFQLVTDPKFSNITFQIKGWPGPIIRQRDLYPPNMQSPKQPSEFQEIAGDRFNSELALFLLVADETDIWMYSWFWGWDDWVPNKSDSTVPSNFFPEAECKLGAPAGRYSRIPGTFTYKRDFEHASVFVDLTNRTASKVTYDGCDL